MASPRKSDPVPPGRRRNNNSESGKDIDLDSYQHFHKSGYDFISKALLLDESGRGGDDRAKAVEFYLQGIAELERGVSVIDDVPEHLRNLDEERFARAQGIKDKMMKNLKLAQERVDDLSEELQLNRKNIPAGSPDKKFGSASLPRNAATATGAQRKFNAAAKDAPKIPAPRQRNLVTNRLVSDPTRAPRSVSGGREKPTPPFSSRSKLPVLKGSTTARPDSSGAVTPKTQRKHVSALKNVDTAMAQLILDQVIDNSPGVTWDAIAGQESAKQALQETVVWPALRPEVFTGLRAPARGLLLFGPPGNGKTLLAKAVATESRQTFFNISASTLTSKWVGEGEKLVRALFACAKELQPSIIFIDEIDSILSARKDSEHDAVRRLKTEFLVQFDGVGTSSEDRILVMGATNLPQELDLAALRRFPKRIMIPLPDDEARMSMIKRLLRDHQHSLTQADFDEVAVATEGYSGSDLAALAKDAAMGPIREIDPSRVPTLKHKEIRPITKEDFLESTRRIRSSVPESSLADLEKWSQKYGDCT
ncbi:Spastin [Hypsibius exemplaris]|uniref:microtubule-severing ATPase n=1 Tax=Hypsibius exemplaris TaxID=2072580 RepID=A0A1W0X803_HYPEX|nr:Spastin [Hypsibius exemplaris]